MEEPDAKKVVDIKSSSWKNIISVGKEKRLNGSAIAAAPEPSGGDFFLSFDAPVAPPKP